MRITALTIALALLPAPVFAAKHCKKGKPCGNACIAVSKTCHVGTGTNDGRDMGMFLAPPVPTDPPPTPEPPSTTNTSPTGGFDDASKAALECGRAHGAAPYQSITIELVVDGRGVVVSSSAAGVDRSTALGKCVADVAVEHFELSTSEHGLRSARYTFVVGSPDSADTPARIEERVATAPDPPQKQCRREDFASFDGFVECRVAERGSPVAPPVVASPVDLAEHARQREADEARAVLGQRSKERATARAEEELRRRRATLALVIAGSVLDAAGIGLLVAAAGAGEAPAATESFDAGPTCTIGKRCGNTCIAAELTCHAPTTAVGSFEAKPALLWPGIAAMAIGSGLLVAALVVHRRSDSQTTLIVDARGIGLRF